VLDQSDIGKFVFGWLVIFYNNVELDNNNKCCDANSFAGPDPGSGAFLPPGEIFLNYLKNPCSFIFLLIRLAPETIRSKKKVGFIFHPSFYVQ
jgi:hypothetical protein